MRDKRQRIVINLEGPQAEGARPVRKRRRWPRVLGILALLILLVVGVAATEAFLWLRNYRRMPAYTVVVLVDAAARNDVAEFQKHINEDEIVKNMVTTVSQKAAGRYGYALNSSIQQQIDERVPSLLPTLKESIRKEVKAGIAFNGLAPHGRSFVYLLFNVPPLLTVTTEGDKAKVMLPRGNLMLELTMQRDTDGWKLTEFKEEIAVQRIVDSIMKDLPAIGKIDANSPLLKKPERRRKNR
jgi:hypothetical protein